jgi:hypothetical protein
MSKRRYPLALVATGYSVLLAWMILALPSLALGHPDPGAAARVFWIEAFPLAVASWLLLSGGILSVLPRTDGKGSFSTGVVAGISIVLGALIAYRIARIP